MELITEMQYHQVGRDTLIQAKHSHENCYEIIQTISNDGCMIIKDALYPISHGALFFIDAAEMHCSAPADPNHYVRNKVILNRSTCDNLMACLDCLFVHEKLFGVNGGLAIELNNQTALEIDSLFMEIQLLLKDSNRDTYLAVAERLIRLFRIGFQNLDSLGRILPGMVSDALSYINANITSDITIDDIAGKLHISKSYLCHAFKKATAQTIMGYISECRMAMAKKKLLYTDERISEIAASAGFSNYSYFSRAFLEYTGLTPSRYRKTLGQGLNSITKPE